MKTKITHHNSQRSAKSISKKLAILEHWIETGVPVQQDSHGNELFKNGEPLYVSIPTSMSKFLRWTDEKAGIMSTGQGALINYLSLKNLDGSHVETLLDKINKKLQMQKILTNSIDLKNQLTEAWKLINAQNKDLSRYLSEIKSLEEEVKSLTAEIKNIEESTDLKHAKMEGALNRLNQQLLHLRNMRVIDDKK